MAGVDIIEAVSRGRRVAMTLGVLALLVAFLGLGLPAYAQQNPGGNPGGGNPGGGNPGGDPGRSCDNPSDPYSGGNPHCDEQNRLTIELSLESGPPGSTFVVDASGFEPGDTATITFGGVVVRTSTATPKTALGSGRLAVIGAFLPVQLPFLRGQTTGGASISERVTVPDVAPGPYDVCVSADGAGTACDTFRVTPGTSVGGASFTRPAGNGTGGTSVSGLARTGLALLPFLVLAVILVVLGRYLVSKSRESRRA